MQNPIVGAKGRHLFSLSTAPDIARPASSRRACQLLRLIPRRSNKATGESERPLDASVALVTPDSLIG